MPELVDEKDAEFLPAASGELEPKLAAAGPWTQLMWNASANTLRQTLDLEFIRGLKDGSLDEWEFTAYQRQDALYLNHYSRALATLAA